jgi:hypothetical protein
LAMSSLASFKFAGRENAGKLSRIVDRKIAA